MEDEGTRRDLQAHPIAACWPGLSEQELHDLAQDIKRNGLRHPIRIDEASGTILDGNQRYRALRKLGRRPGAGQLEYFRKDATDAERLTYVLSMNQQRRHLDADARARATVDSMKTAGGTFPAGRPKGGEDDTFSITAGKVAQTADTTKHAARKAIREAKAAVPHVSRNTGENEWYTPTEIIEAARAVMGGIDLDPASSAVANEKYVRATRFFTRDDDGLSRLWYGRVWMNPPYAAKLIGRFVERLLEQPVEQAVVLVNNGTETKWGQALLAAASAVCLPARRIRFLDPDGNPGGGPLQGQMIVGIRVDPDAFRREFAGMGTIRPKGGEDDTFSITAEKAIRNAKAAGARKEKQVVAHEREQQQAAAIDDDMEREHLADTERTTRYAFCELDGCPMATEREDGAAVREQGLKDALGQLDKMSTDRDNWQSKAGEWKARFEGARKAAQRMEDALRKGVA